jgi:hypothetical protein
MPWTPYRVPDNQSVGERGVVVSTGGVDREEFFTDPRNHDRVVTDMTCKQAGFAERFDWDTLSEIGTVFT